MPAPSPRASAADADARAAMDALRRLVRALRGSARAAARPDARGPELSAAQLFVLRTVAAEPGIALGAVADRTHTRQSTASEVVARLAERGLLERRADPADGRRSLLHLAPAARPLVRAARRTVPERLVAALDAMPAGERRALAAGLTRWVQAAGLEGVAPRMFFEAGGPGRRPQGGNARAGSGV